MKKVFLLFHLFLALSINAFSQPSEGAPAPSHIAKDVISIFSDTYTNHSGTNFSPWWWQSTQVTQDYVGDSNNTLIYSNFNYQGTDFGGAIDVSSMDSLHVDMWTSDATFVKIICISKTGDKQVGTPDTLTVTPNTWVSYDIPLSAFTGVDMTHLIQLEFDGGNGKQTIYLDNIYFYKKPTPAGTDATLSDLKVNGVTIKDFSVFTRDYTYMVPYGITDVPEITVTTTDENATYIVDSAKTLQDTTFIKVTALDAVTTLTYRLMFKVESGIPATAAPIPSHKAADVISIYSDSYTNHSGTNFNPWWWQSTVVTETSVETNNAMFTYSKFNYQGIEFGGAIDVSSMDSLHVDMWTSNAPFVRMICISKTGGNQVGIPDTLAVTPGKWVSYDIPLSAFTKVDMTHLLQLEFDGGNGDQTIYLDNIYFYKGLLSGINNKELKDISVFGNNRTVYIRTDNRVLNGTVEVYDMTGRQVVVKTIHSSSTQLNINETGLVIIKITDDENKTFITRKIVLK
jgi:hypothetical protein